MMVCKRVRFSGRVQGVGFRYTTQRLAQGFAVAGYVRNLPDGEVELVAEGTAEEVEGFVNAVSQRMSAYVEEQSDQEEKPQGYKGFVIRGLEG